ncbi:MAG TPA: amidohydrolase family protein [Chitinophagaceae bacterium]|nr:amidohydrolase family protein [Chitinophagaceae bacterium]
MSQRIADTHIHIWDFKKADYAWLKGNTSVLNRTYSIEEIETERKEIGICAGILVQAANNFEDTDWMLHTASQHEWIKGVVGWLPLMNPDATVKALQNKYGKESYFKGVRHLIHDEPYTDWLLQEPVLVSLGILAEHNIPFDVVGVLPAHIETALKVAKKVPGLRMVFDHLNQPPIASGERFGKWGELMIEAAQHPGFYMKISGMGTTSGKGEGWTSVDIQPYVEFALEHFGTDRCFCGGDWPVSLLAGSYTATWKNYGSVLADLLDKESLDKVLYTNAARFYSF